MDSRRLLLRMGALLGAGLLLWPATAVAQHRAARVEITPSDAQVTVGGTQPFVATAYDNAGVPISTATFVWTSKNPTAATVDRESGIVTGVAPGVAIITATTGSGRYAKSAQATLQVTGQGPQPQPQPQPQAAAPPPVTRPAAPVAAGGHLSGPGCAAAEREPAGSGPAVGLAIDPLRVSLVKGESQQLVYRPVQANGDPAERLCVTFQLQPGDKAASVDSFGLVLGIDTGRAKIQVTIPNKSFPPRLVDVEVRGDSVRFRSHEISMVPGATDTLRLVVPAQNNRPINPSGIFQFVSSDTTKVRVAALTPIVTALAPGTARITAQSSVYPDIPITIDVHRRVARLVVSPADSILTLAIGAQTTLSARPQAADTSAVNEVPLRWTVSDTTLAQYDTATKLLRGLKMGDVRVRVTVPVANDTVVSREWRVRVIAGGLAISRPGTKVAMGVGEHLPVEVKLLDDKRQPIETLTRVTWTTSADSIARVADGQLTGVGMGRARVTARSAWDSTITSDVTVVGDLLVYALRNGRWDIYMLDHAANGQPLKMRQLTQDTTIKSAPAWSPTLTQIAYVAAPGLMGNSDAYMLDLETGLVRRLTHDSATVRSPVFVGPTGDQFVFESSKDGKAQIYVMKTDGTGRRQLTRGDAPNTAPDVSPDGRRVIYGSVRDKNYDVYEENLDGTGERRLTNSPRPEDSPRYAADGRSFYYLRDEGGNPLTKRVYRQDLTTGAATPVTPVGLFVQAFSVSADGSMLALLTLAADANGVQTARLVSFNVATGAMAPIVLPGADRIAGPAFRPPTPQH